MTFLRNNPQKNPHFHWAQAARTWYICIEAPGVYVFCNTDIFACHHIAATRVRVMDWIGRHFLVLIVCDGGPKSRI